MFIIIISLFIISGIIIISCLAIICFILEVIAIFNLLEGQRGIVSFLKGIYHRKPAVTMGAELGLAESEDDDYLPTYLDYVNEEMTKSKTHPPAYESIFPLNEQLELSDV